MGKQAVYLGWFVFDFMPSHPPSTHFARAPYFLLISLIEARLAVFPRLLKLSGRLDLMLSHVSAALNIDDEDFYTPVTAYEEPESDEELLPGDDLDDDSDVMDDDDEDEDEEEDEQVRE